MENDLNNFSNSLADAVARAEQSVVSVMSRGRHGISGLVSSVDHVLTIAHVLEGDDGLRVRTHDGRTLPATLVGRDPSTDLALLKVADLKLEPAVISSEPARIGQFVMLVVRPDELMASHGIVSGVTGPVRMGRGLILERVIHSDAAPYPGCSGGAMIDSSGAVIGVTNAGLARGNALAIPSKIAWRVAQTLADGTALKRPYLGLGSQPVHLPESARAGRDQALGLLVISIEPQSPAASAGVLLGDIVVGFAGMVVQDTDDLLAQLTLDRSGQTVMLEVSRAGELKTLSVTVGERVNPSGTERAEKGRGDREGRGDRGGHPGRSGGRSGRSN
jgi:S1-C subfamily serine protease